MPPALSVLTETPAPQFIDEPFALADSGVSPDESLEFDLINEFIEFTNEFVRDTPDIFRRWCGIALVAGALERRVWTTVGGWISYPNLYTLLIAPPGTGKGLIEIVRDLWTATPDPTASSQRVFHVGPDSMTKAALIDNLAKAKCIRLAPSGAGLPTEYHSLLICAEEFQNFMVTYDVEMNGTLISLWNNKALHEESRRTGNARFVSIINPTLNILGGIQPGKMSEVFPEQTWNSGLDRRMVMVYSWEKEGKKAPLSMFHRPGQARIDHFLSRLSELSQMNCELKWSDEAWTRFERWEMEGCQPRPTHPKLVNYTRTRPYFIIKLSLISAVSRACGTHATTGGNRPARIEMVDLKRASHWLLSAEAEMPNVFRAMSGKTDHSILEELHLWVLGEFARSDRKGVRRAEIIEFISRRTTSEKIERLFVLAENMDYIYRVPNSLDLWGPRVRIEVKDNKEMLE